MLSMHKAQREVQFPIVRKVEDERRAPCLKLLAFFQGVVWLLRISAESRFFATIITTMRTTMTTRLHPLTTLLPTKQSNVELFIERLSIEIEDEGAPKPENLEQAFKRGEMLPSLVRSYIHYFLCSCSHIIFQQHMLEKSIQVHHFAQKAHISRSGITGLVS